MKNLIDTHMHIYDEAYNGDRELIIKDINENIDLAVCISCDYESSMECIKYANENEKIYATIGYHPCDIKKYDHGKMIELLELSKVNKKILAIGEIGLDYHWMNDPKEIQKIFFKLQLELAREYNLPVVIHTRDALDDTISILKEYKDVRGIMHCYPGSYEHVKPILDRFYVGVGGTITFKNNRKGIEMLEKIGIENIVLETDAPYLTPVPFRGKRNNPIYIEHVAQKIAEVKNMDVEEVKRITTENAKRIYNL